MAADVTLASVRNVVRLRGDYQSSLTFDNAYLNLEIQSAWAELHELIDDTNEHWWDTQGTTPTVAAQAYAALPSTCKRVQGVDLLSGSDYIEMRQIETGRRNSYGSATGQPAAYRLSARGLELFPTPDAIYTLRVTFSPLCPALHETNGIELYGLHEYIVTGTLLRLDQREERPLSERLAELERQRQRVVKAATGRIKAAPQYLMLYDSVDPEDLY